MLGYGLVIMFHSSGVIMLPECDNITLLLSSVVAELIVINQMSMCLPVKLY